MKRKHCSACSIKIIRKRLHFLRAASFLFWEIFSGNFSLRYASDSINPGLRCDRCASQSKTDGKYPISVYCAEAGCAVYKEISFPYKAQPPELNIRAVVMIKKKLYHQHGISVAEEIVFLFHRHIIGLNGQIITGKSAYHNQQAGFG